jgi:long-chain acyl-CoA synthetase
VQRINAGLDPHERLECLVLTTHPWTVEAGLLTPTMKARRPKIEQLYLPHIEAWSQSVSVVVWAE